MVSKLGALYTVVLKAVIGVMSTVLLVVTGYAVFSRNILDRSVVWADTVASWLFVWLIFLGGAVAVTKNAHMEIGIGKDSLPPTPRKWITILGYAATAAASAFLAYAGWHLVKISGDTPSPATGTTLKWVLWSFPVGGGLMALCALERLVNSLLTPPEVLQERLDAERTRAVGEEAI